MITLIKSSIVQAFKISATVPFLPAGLSFGYIFFLPWIDAELYSSVSFWPHFAMLFSIVVTASMITIIKLNNGKYIFEHFSYLLAASLLYIIAGIIFVVLRDKREFSFSDSNFLTTRHREFSESRGLFLNSSVTFIDYCERRVSELPLYCEHIVNLIRLLA